MVVFLEAFSKEPGNSVIVSSTSLEDSVLELDDVKVGVVGETESELTLN